MHNTHRTGKTYRAHKTYRSHSNNNRRPLGCSSVTARSRGRRRSAVIHRLLTAAAVLVFLLAISVPVSRLIGTAPSVVQAEQNLGEIQYKLVEIRKGDSLWSIARDNMGPGYSDIYEYIHDIRDCNQLKTNDITSGSYLMIPYYNTETFDCASIKQPVRR